MRRLLHTIAFLSLAALVSATPALAVDFYWGDSTGLVDDTTKWVDVNGDPLSAVPGTGDNVYVKNGGTMTITASNLFTGNPTAFHVGSGDPAGPTGAGAGHVIQTGGDVVLASSGGSNRLYIGYNGAPGTSIYDLQGGSLDSVGYYSVIGHFCKGIFNISGTASYNTNSRMYVGDSANGDGELNMSGSATVTSGNSINIATGTYATGLVSMTGSASLTMPNTGGTSYIGRYEGSNGTVNMSGMSTMTVNSDGFQVGSNGTVDGIAKGTINLSGGTEEVTGAVMTVNKNVNFGIWDNSQGNLNVHNYAQFRVLGNIYLGDNSDSVNTEAGEGNILVDGHGQIFTGGFFLGNYTNGVGNVTLSDYAIVTASGYSEFGRLAGTASLTMNDDAKYYGVNGRIGGTYWDTPDTGGTVDIEMNDNSRIEFTSFLNLGEKMSTCTFTMNDQATVQAGSVDFGWNPGASSTGTINGTSSITTGGTLNVAVSGATGLLNCNNDSTLSIGGNLRVGQGGGADGTLNMNSTSDITIGTTTSIGYTDSFGRVNLLDSSTLTATGDTMMVGLYGGSGYLTVSNNAQATIEDVQLGVNWGADETDLGIGTVTVDGAGAVVTVVGAGTHKNDNVNEFDNTITIGAAGGQGTWNQNAGLTTCSNVVILGEVDYYDWDTAFSAGQGTLNLNGGTFACPGISTRSNVARSTATSGTVNFNGGVLKAMASNADFLAVDDPAAATMTLNVQAGGAVIDTDGFDIAIQQAMVDGGGGGGMTKMGDGVLTLAGANTYTGATSVQAGALSVTGSITSDVTVDAAAVLMGTGTIDGNVAMAAGSELAPGASVGTLTVDGDVTVGGTLDVEYDSDAETIDLLAVSGTLDLDGATISFSDLGAGTLESPALIFATYGTLSGTPLAPENVPTNYYVDYAYGGNNVALVMVPEPSVIALLLGLGLTLAALRFRR